MRVPHGNHVRDLNHSFEVTQFKISLEVIKWEPESYKIGSRLSDWSFDFKESNELETQQLCSVNRPISLKSKWFDNLLKLFAL